MGNSKAGSVEQIQFRTHIKLARHKVSSQETIWSVVRILIRQKGLELHFAFEKFNNF